MIASITEPVTVTVGKTKLSLRFDGRARYRLQSIGSNIDLSEFGKPNKSFVTLVNWAWACSIKCPFEHPEDLANAVESGEAGPLLEAVLQCVKEALQPDEEKKA